MDDPIIEIENLSKRYSDSSFEWALSGRRLRHVLKKFCHFLLSGADGLEARVVTAPVIQEALPKNHSEALVKVIESI
jgi:hypothetical protein